MNDNKSDIGSKYLNYVFVAIDVQCGYSKLSVHWPRCK